MADDLQKAIADTVSRIPEWVRKELLSSDAATRARAEETIAAMIQNVLDNAAR